ncbi:putative pentatricopeptide repeat-containing protein [Cocos nucifera]|nr:putative pentatricopeptide repeat-containing protein [Cocos nucifera]
MRRNKCQPDLCSYATMVSAYVNASDMDGAEKFFRRLKEDGLKPNAVVYGTLMKGYAKLNNLEKVMRVYERMRMQGVEANQTIYTTIMDAYGKNSDFGSAVIWFKEMDARGFPPDQKAKNILLSLAKMPEEQKEANELIGNAVGSLPDIPEPKASNFAESDSEIEDNDELSGAEAQSFETKLAASEPTELNSSILSDFDPNDEEAEDDDSNFGSFEDKQELALASQLLDS